jgi:hypothetical protein
MKVGSHGFTFIGCSKAEKGVLQPSTERLKATPLCLFSRGCNSWTGWDPPVLAKNKVWEECNGKCSYSEAKVRQQCH